MEKTLQDNRIALKQKIMKLKTFLFFLLMISAAGSYAQIGIQTNSPDASSALDIVSTDKGLLIPRVTLTSNLSSPSPVTSPATGLMVFNTGANQPIGLYYWSGSKWVSSAGSPSSSYWGLTGNTGTNPSTNFLGTTDNQDLAVYTNNSERMRVMANGQVVIGQTAPNSSTDLFTAVGNATQTWAINGYGNLAGVYGSGSSYGVYGSGGTYGLVGAVNSSSSFAVRGDNQDANGWAGIFAGSGQTATVLSGRSAGLSTIGNDGIFAVGNSSSGIGIIAGGSGVSTFSTIATGTGGAFTGFHGIYGHGTDVSTGIGVIGVGNNGSSYYTTTTGSGGAFSGKDGVYGHATNASGIGVIGVSNSGTYISVSNGSGGSYTGYHGIVAKGNSATYGNGVIGIGNNSSSYYTFSDGAGHHGSGGAFTGTGCGVYAVATRNNNYSIGVYGYYDGAGSGRNGIGVKGVAKANSGRGYGVYGKGNKYGVYANGNLGASGTKSFVIDDPLDPENKILKHYTIESNEVLNMYRGVVQLDGNGEAQVTLPGYFTAININYSYTLTSIGVPAPGLYIKEEIDEDGKFRVAGGKPDQKVSWVVYADRNDRYMQKYRERETDVIEKDENEKGKYIMPELYNQPPEKGIFHDGNMEQKRVSVEETPVIRIKTKNIKRTEVERDDSKLKDKK